MKSKVKSAAIRHNGLYIYIPNSHWALIHFRGLTYKTYQRFPYVSVQNLDADAKEILNIVMKQYRATIRVSGLVAISIVFAENVNLATKFN